MPDQETVIVLALCEYEKLFLQPFTTYEFQPVEDCKRCEELLAQHNRDYHTDLKAVPSL